MRCTNGVIHYEGKGYLAVGILTRCGDNGLCDECRTAERKKTKGTSRRLVAGGLARLRRIGGQAVIGPAAGNSIRDN